MNDFWIPILIASLAGSLHCAAMCGPFAASVAAPGPAGRFGFAPQVAYHLGRLVTYLALGAAAGLAGGALDLAGRAAGIGRASAIVAGLLLIGWGLSALLAARGLVPLRRRAPQRLGALLGRALASFARLHGVPRGFLLGLSTTLVPCGWLYAFVATAAATADVSSALAVMAAFWLGTVPALVAAAFGFRSLVRRLGARARLASASLILVSGIALLVLRVGAPSPAFAEAAESTPATKMPANCPLHRHGAP